jgi:hypothetical protein
MTATSWRKSPSESKGSGDLLPIVSIDFEGGDWANEELGGQNLRNIGKIRKVIE